MLSRLCLRACAASLLLLAAACASKPTSGPAVSQTGPDAPAPSGPARAPNGPVSGSSIGGVAPGSAADFAAQAQDRVYFALDSHDLDEAGRATLDAQAAWLTRYPAVTLLIAGNADERGTREYNFALGARRAEAVRTYLAARGVSPARMHTVSYGKERPVDPRPSEEGWAMNRNGQTVIGG
jgi:peptidoglycan-associated lipoprotein